LASARRGKEDMIPRFKPWLGWPEFFALLKRNSNAVEKFEKEFAKTFNAVDAVAFPYGRSAQWAFFKSLGIENGEVIMPAYTCSVVAHAVTLSGNTPRFIDINLNDYNMNLDKAELAINKNTRAIIATHTFGNPQDIDRLEAIVKKAEQYHEHKIWLIQDCCHAFGAEWKGRMIGTSGDVAIYAFNISKTITSIFGGMLTFQDKSLANKLRDWRDQNFKSHTFFKSIKRRLYLLAVYFAFHKKIYNLTWWLQHMTPLLDRFTKAFHLDEKICFPPDYLQKMTDVEAAVGLEQLKKYPEIIKYRRKKARYYHMNLPKNRGWRFPSIIRGSTYSHYVVGVSNREDVIAEYKAKGIELGELIQYSIPNLKEYSSLNSNCPIADEASKTCINFTVS
jgi:perosamine synthetase